MARKLGNDEMIEEFIQRIHNATEEKRKIFEEENIQKHNEFIVSKQKKKKICRYLELKMYNSFDSNDFVRLI